jgi:hypothetical protein
MRDEEIDDALRRATDDSPALDPALLARITGSIGSDLRPVRPLPPSGLLVCALVVVCAAAAVTGATLLGLHGVRAMSATEIGLIFPVLGILICLAAVVCVSEVIPGSRYRTAPFVNKRWVLPAAGCVILIGVFAAMFQDYRTERFVAQGVKCLTAGLLQAIPAAVGTWWVLRRGFAVNSLAAGLAQGTLAGLAGVSMLELHCANLEAPHVMLWHTVVIPLSGAAGALMVWTARSRVRKP